MLAFDASFGMRRFLYAFGQLLKLLSVSSIAVESAYGLLVIWHNIQSPRPASAKTTAGRTFECDRSENGNLTRTIDPIEGVTTLHLPPADSNHLPMSFH